MNTEHPYKQYMYSYPHKTAYGSLSGIHLSDYADAFVDSENSLYMHIPFCQYKCGYCNLFSVTGSTEDFIDSYISAMERHAVQVAQILPANTSFYDLTLGGGTPLLLSETQLHKVFAIARDRLHFDGKSNPIVIETSPNQTTLEKLQLLKEEHVNRISIGVQSFHDHELKALHRLHDSISAKQALDLIKSMDFECVNLDLIYGIPGQTWDSLLSSLEQALMFSPDEIFIYPLYIKPDTLLYIQQTERATDTVLLQRKVRDYLMNAGYMPHSMRRFVKKSAVKSVSLPESLCGFGNTLSIGCGGRSYVKNLHFCTPYKVRQNDCKEILRNYISTTDYLSVPHGYLLSLDEQKRRYVIKHILFGRGIQKAHYQQLYHTSVLEDFPIIQDWIADGYALEDVSYITLTEEGFLLSDYLGPQLISPEVAEKSAKYYGNI